MLRLLDRLSAALRNPVQNRTDELPYGDVPEVPRGLGPDTRLTNLPAPSGLNGFGTHSGKMQHD